MISRYWVQRIHGTEPRWRGKCSECGKVRLRTQITLRDDQGRILVEWLCNDCLTRTPAWGSGS